MHWDAALGHPCAAGVAQRVRAHVNQSGALARRTKCPIAALFVVPIPAAADVEDAFAVQVNDIAEVASAVPCEAEERQQPSRDRLAMNLALRRPALPLALEVDSASAEVNLWPAQRQDR